MNFTKQNTGSQQCDKIQMLEYDAIYTGKYFLDPKLEGTNLL
jgi:hypothetical protein